MVGLDTVHYGHIGSREMPKAMIVDGNRLDTELLKSILKYECSAIHTESSSEEGLSVLLEALLKGEPFDVLFIDKQKEEVAVTEMLKAYREIEKRDPQKTSIYAVSITANPRLDLEEWKLYNSILYKPFKQGDIYEVLTKIIQ